MKQIEQLSKLLPLGSIFLILCSSIKLVLFYKIYKISIVEYITIGEYLTLFIDDILYYLATFSIGLIGYFVSNDFTEERNTVKVDWKKNTKSIIIIIILIIILISSILFFVSNSKIESQKYQIIGVGIYGILNLLFVLSTKTNFNFPYPILVLISLIMYSIMDGTSDAYKILENAGNSKNTIEFKDKKITTNKNLVYLGKSEKYFFLYEINTKTSIIIPNENLVQLTTSVANTNQNTAQSKLKKDKINGKAINRTGHKGDYKQQK